jgi:hypothetical protein
MYPSPHEWGEGGERSEPGEGQGSHMWLPLTPALSPRAGRGSLQR